MAPGQTMTIPHDFPRSFAPAALTGAQPKVSVRKVAGHYINEPTDVELVGRYEICRDLAEQLFSYCERKQLQHPQWSRTEFEDKLTRALRLKRWELSDEELHWCLSQAMQRLNWNGATSEEDRNANHRFEGTASVRK